MARASCEHKRKDDSLIGEEISSFSEFWTCDGTMGEVAPLRTYVDKRFTKSRISHSEFC
jgi:hypothetical protein